MRVALILPLSFVLLAFLFWFAGYVAHCFLHVLNETGQGRNEVAVSWPSDGYYERFWNALYLTALAALGFVPGLLLVRLSGWLRGENEVHTVLAALVVGTVAWLLLPIPLLSVLSGRHHWEIFRWKVIRAFAKDAAMIGAFYLASVPLVIGCLLVAHFAVAGWTELREAATLSPIAWLPEALEYWSWLFVLPLAGALCASALLIYARLLGRLAWLLDLAEAEEEEPPPNEAIPAPSNLVASHDTRDPASSQATAPLETYGLLDEEPPTVLPAGPIPERAMPAPSIGVAAQRVEPPSAVRALPERVQPSPILEVPVKSAAARRLLVRGIFQFPWYRASLAAWIVLTLGCLFTLLLVRLMVLVLS